MPSRGYLGQRGAPYYFSLDFNLAGHALPPADPATVVATFPRLSWGVILFDSLVMNFDRHEENIAHAVPSRQLQIFDHSHAFLHAGAQDIPSMLASYDSHLCIGGHCLAQEIVDLDGWDIWVSRIEQIPDFFIEGIIEAVVPVGLPDAHKHDCIHFVKKRRSELRSIVKAHQNEFPKLRGGIP